MSIQVFKYYTSPFRMAFSEMLKKELNFLEKRAESHGLTLFEVTGGKFSND